MAGDADTPARQFAAAWQAAAAAMDARLCAPCAVAQGFAEFPR